MRLGPVKQMAEYTRVFVPDFDPWQNVPNLKFNRDDRKVKLNANHCDNANPKWGVPCFAGSSHNDLSTALIW